MRWKDISSNLKKDSTEFEYTQLVNGLTQPQIWPDIKELDEITMILLMGGEPLWFLNI